MADNGNKQEANKMPSSQALRAIIDDEIRRNGKSRIGACAEEEHIDEDWSSDVSQVLKIVDAKLDEVEELINGTDAEEEG